MLPASENVFCQLLKTFFLVVAAKTRKFSFDDFRKQALKFTCFYEHSYFIDQDCRVNFFVAEKTGPSFS